VHYPTSAGWLRFQRLGNAFVLFVLLAELALKFTAFGKRYFRVRDHSLTRSYWLGLV
jgi:hypothetical protein